jgi:transcriptional regulator with XRE-family HTH domain
MRDKPKLRQGLPRSCEADSDGGLPHRSTGRERLSTKRIEIAIGLEVRSLRKSRSLTIAALSAAAGISTGMLSKVENGAISSSMATLYALATALSVPISRLLARIDDLEHLSDGAEKSRHDHCAAAADATVSTRSREHVRRCAAVGRDQDRPTR